MAVEDCELQRNQHESTIDTGKMCESWRPTQDLKAFRILHLIVCTGWFGCRLLCFHDIFVDHFARVSFPQKSLNQGS